MLSLVGKQRDENSEIHIPLSVLSLAPGNNQQLAQSHGSKRDLGIGIPAIT